MHSLLRLLCALLAASMFSVHAHEGHLPQVEGVIKKIDSKNGVVTIAHGHIPNLNMSPMTMSFKAKDPSLLAPFKEGDKIRFRSADVKGTLTVLSIEAAK